jgi:hypothetical protein
MTKLQLKYVQSFGGYTTSVAGDSPEFHFLAS